MKKNEKNFFMGLYYRLATILKVYTLILVAFILLYKKTTIFFLEFEII